MNDPHADLQSYFDGELTDASAGRFGDHLASCASCQRELRSLMCLELASAHAVRAKGAPPIDVLVGAASALRARWPLALALAGLCVLVAFQVDVLWPAGAPARSWEDRAPSQPHQRYEPFRGDGQTSRGVEGRSSSPSLLERAWLELRGDPAGIARAYLRHGQLDMARWWLDRAPPSADALATRAALALRQGKPEEAMDAAQEALRLQEGHPAALWNRALALKKLNLPLAAAETYSLVAALGEEGWADEARVAARELREQGMARQERHREAVSRCAAAMRGEPPGPLGVAAVSERLARLCFYDAVRKSGTVEALAALEPAAVALDRHFGTSALSRGLAAAKAGVTASRRDISGDYARTLESGKGNDVQWLAIAEAARADRQRDLELGALFFVSAGKLDLARYQELARGAQDPWFDALAEEKTAEVESWQGQPLQALERLRRIADARCPRGAMVHVADRCSTIERAIALYLARLNQTREAKDWGERAREYARDEGDLTVEIGILKELGQVARLRAQLGMSHVYLEEVLAREPTSCESADYARSNLAIAHQRVMDFAEARLQMDMLEGCDSHPPSLARVFTLADLQRIAPRPGDEAVLQRAKVAAQDGRWNAEDRALFTHILGRARLEHDRAEGERLLRQAISEAEALSGTDRAADKARLHSYTSLIMDAGKRGDFDSVLHLFAEERGWASPRPCSLWLTTDNERLLTVAVDGGGGTLGRYEGALSSPPGAGALVPPELLAVLRPCPAVEVVARPPLEGRPDLLPQDFSWSQVVRRGAPLPPGNGPRVVVASPTLPQWLRRLPRLTALPRLPGVVWLEGRDATPARVLEAARTASLLELHLHGLVDPEVADGSFLALAEEPPPSRRYALTAGDVRREKLAGHPLVLLAACHSGEMVSDLLESYGLPKAFVEAGARAVLAVPTAIPDSESEPFFRPLVERIQSGVAPAVALREARAAWRQSHPGPSWVDSVLLFE